jgi:hypothetical protein
VSLHYTPSSWQKQPSIGYAPLNNGLHSWSQGWHLGQKSSLFVVKMSGNMPLAPERAIDIIFQHLIKERLCGFECARPHVLD